MHKPVPQSFIIILKYYVLYVGLCAVLLYAWQRRFVDTSLTTHTHVSCALCYDVTVATTSLSERRFSAPLQYHGTTTTLYVVLC